MSDILNLNSPSRPLTGNEMQKAQSVKTMGIIALVLSILGIFVPFILDIVAFILAKVAMKISRENLVPYDYEKFAYWAYRISIVGILLWVVAVIRILA